MLSLMIILLIGFKWSYRRKLPFLVHYNSEDKRMIPYNFFKFEHIDNETQRECLVAIKKAINKGTENYIENLTELVNNNISEAYVIMGLVHHLGIFPNNINDTKAFEYFERGMELGSNECKTFLSIFYHYGLGVEANLKHSKYLSSGDDVYSILPILNSLMNNPSDMLIYGDKEKSIYSICRTYRMHSKIFLTDDFLKTIDNVDYPMDSIVKLYDKSESNFEEGLMYFNLHFYNESIKYFEASVKDDEDYRAISYLAEIYYHGFSVEKNYTKAAYLVEDGIQHNESFCYFLKGKMIYNGEYYIQNKRKAQEFLKNGSFLSNVDQSNKLFHIPFSVNEAETCIRNFRYSTMWASSLADDQKNNKEICFKSEPSIPMYYSLRQAFIALASRDFEYAYRLYLHNAHWGHTNSSLNAYLIAKHLGIPNLELLKDVAKHSQTNNFELMQYYAAQGDRKYIKKVSSMDIGFAYEMGWKNRRNISDSFVWLDEVENYNEKTKVLAVVTKRIILIRGIISFLLCNSTDNIEVIEQYYETFKLIGLLIGGFILLISLITFRISMFYKNRPNYRLNLSMNHGASSHM